MNESFEAIVFGMREGAWQVVLRKSASELSEGMNWARAELQRLTWLRTYQSLRMRVISSHDDETVDGILGQLRRGRADRPTTIARAARDRRAG